MGMVLRPAGHGGDHQHGNRNDFSCDHSAPLGMFGQYPRFAAPGTRNVRHLGGPAYGRARGRARAASIAPSGTGRTYTWTNFALKADDIAVFAPLCASGYASATLRKDLYKDGGESWP